MSGFLSAGIVAGNYILPILGRMSLVICNWSLVFLCVVFMAFAMFCLRGCKRISFDVSMLLFFFLLGMLLIAPHAGKKQSFYYPKHKEVTLAAKVSDGISAAFHDNFSPYTAGFMDSVILGRHGIKRDVKHIFRDAGTSHVLPVQCRVKLQLTLTNTSAVQKDCKAKGYKSKQLRNCIFRG